MFYLTLPIYRHICAKFEYHFDTKNNHLVDPALLTHSIGKCPNDRPYLLLVCHLKHLLISRRLVNAVCHTLLQIRYL